MIPLFKVHMPESVMGPLKDVLMSGYIGQGPKVEAFEKALVPWVGHPNILSLNSGTSALYLALKLAGVGYEDEVISTPQTCLHYSSPILLTDGSTKRIGEIVSKKMGIDVVSLNLESGALEPRRVTGWVKTKPTEPWFRVRCKSKRGSRGPGGKWGVWMTGDHNVLTQDGWKRVDCLRSGDKIATAQRSLNDNQAKAMDGILLGDGHINRFRKGHTRFVLVHAEDQSEWFDLSLASVKGFRVNRHLSKAREGHQAAWYAETSRGIQWSALRERWYSVKGKKIVPNDLKLDPLTLAAWYMDDGCRVDKNCAVLCTEGFDTTSLWKLFWKLADIGFRPTIHAKRKGHAIRLGGDSAKAFFSLIAAYIPGSMRYKLPDNGGLLPGFDSTLWNLGQSEILFDEVDVVQDVPEKGGCSFCIEVEGNHNFISGDIILKNCMATNTPIVDHKAKIVWADINPWTGNIDPVDVERKITPKTKAIMAVHWGGYPCELDELGKISKKYGIPIIEDAAHSFGSIYHGRKVGSISNFTCFSLQAIKHLTAIDGGLLVASTNEGYRRGKLLRWYGIDRETPRRDLRCLHGYSRVKLADGGSMAIRDIVRQKHEGPVLCLGKNGNVAETKIIGWYENNRAKRTVYDVSLASDKYLRRAQLTFDHKVLTKRGYVAVADLRPSDKVASSFPVPSKVQRKIIIGSLLGDAAMATRGQNRIFKRNLVEGHTRIEGEYLRLKAMSLKGLGSQVYLSKQNLDQKRPNPSVGYWLPCLPSLQEFGEAFYKDRKKRVPRKLLENEWSNIVLACWFMDDGSTDVHNGRERIFPYCQLATNGFPKNDVFWLARFLTKKGYECSAKNHKGSPGYRLFFTRKASDKIINDISPYVPPSMRVKVAHSGKAFDPALWGDGSSGVFYDHVKIRKSKWGGKKVYCIRVQNESHNFFAAPLVVANCEDDVVESGGKMHMNDVCATIGLEQLKYVDKILGAHRENAKFYDERLEGLRRVKKLRYENDRLSAYWLYTIRVDDQESFYDHMAKKGVMVSKVHVRNDIHTCFHGFRKNLPGVEEFSSHEMCIPVGWWVTDQDREHIAKAIEEWSSK